MRREIVNCDFCGRDTPNVRRLCKVCIRSLKSHDEPGNEHDFAFWHHHAGSCSREQDVDGDVQRALDSATESH